MGKKARKFLDPLKLPDPLDVYGEKAAAAQKNANEQAALDREAVVSAQPASAPTLASDDVAAARESERQRKLALAGQSSTILTGPAGLGGGSSGGGKTLLGS